MSIHYKSIENYLRNFVRINNSNTILEIGAAEDSTYLSTLPNTTIIRSNINSSIINVKHFAANQIPYDAQTFDMVFMVATDYFIKNIQETIYEILRVLKKDGTLCILTYKSRTLDKLKNLNKSLGVVSYNHLSEYNRLAIKLSFDFEITRIVNDYINKSTELDLIRSIFYRFLSKRLKLARSPWLAIRITKREL
jgi:SAM-dependent methyltransferase